MNDDEAAAKWMKMVMGTVRQNKDKYGEWTLDIETGPLWDTSDESEDHFEDDLFEI
jgi:hypothetical protein